jgi:4-amino-4-deoxy-L-arabinose transferase-like glycosyltransferase
MDIREKKTTVLISAIIATITAIVLWIMRLENKKSISAILVALVSAIAICLWVWWAKLPSFQDSDRTFKNLEQGFSTITKGDLE